MLKVVSGAYPGADQITEGDEGLISGHIAPYLGKDDDKAHLLEVRALAPAIDTRNEDEVALTSEATSKRILVC